MGEISSPEKNNRHDENLDENQSQLAKTIALSEKSSQTSVHTSVDEKDKEDIESPQLPRLDDGYDGGYGWLVVLGAFCVQVTSFGTCTSVMQDYFHQHYFSDVPNSVVQLSFVGTIAMIFLNGSSPLAQICVSMFGIRPVLIVGTLMVSLGLELAGFSTKIWHLYLTQGVMFGVGASSIYVAIMGVAPQWFSRRRGLALGLVASGSGIGGLIIPFIMNAINSSLGPGWTYRVLGFICLFCDCVACCFVRERVPSTKRRKKLSEIIQIDVIKNVNFVLFIVGSNFSLFGYFIPYFFLPSYATYLGLDSSQGTALVAVSSACNFVGRILTGILADKIGKINTNLLFHFISMISCFLIWTFAFSYSTLLGFSVVFGLFSGSYFAMISPLTAHLVGMEKFPSGLSIMLVTNIIAVFGSDIASAIEGQVNSPPFFSYKMFAGVAYALASIMLSILKFRVNRNPFRKV